MLHRFWVSTVGLLGAALVLPVNAFAQNSPGRTWPNPVPNLSPIAEKDKKPAPRRNLAGMWGSSLGLQSKGVQLKPNDGSPENQPPYTPHGLEVFKSHRALEGFDALPPGENNDPRTHCEPLGVPRYNHYNLGVKIFQDEYSVAILYQYDNRWRTIWTDGRSLPTLADGGVEIDGDFREQRWFGYSVGRWVDDYTLEVQTVGTMPEDRVWLDNPGRPISSQLRVTETLRRLDHDTMEWSETIDDPKMYTRPWQTMQMPMTLLDPRTDVIAKYCSPSEMEAYNRIYGNTASGK